MHIPSNLHNAFSLRYKRIEKLHNANLFENTIFASIFNYDWSMIKCIIESISYQKVKEYNGLKKKDSGANLFENTFRQKK